MRSTWTSLSLGLLFLGVSACSEPASFPAALHDEIQTITNENLVFVGSPGVTVTVSIPGVGETAVASGLSSVAGQVAMRPSDRFRVGSVTKSFTAATLIRLEDEGRLSLDDPASMYVPDLGLPSTITVLDLLNHTAGLFNYTDDASFFPYAPLPWTPEMIIAWSLDTNLAGHGYIFAPESSYKYSNTNYQVAGLVIEAITGVPYHQAIRPYTEDFVGLPSTGIDGFEVPVSDYVDGHLGYDTVVTDQITPGWSWAAGGIISNGHDMCRWETALHRGNVLSPEDRVRIETPTPQSLASNVDVYGIGTMIVTRAGRTLVGHTGTTLGFRVEVFIELESGICVAVMANDFLSSPKLLSEPVWAALADY